MRRAPAERIGGIDVLVNDAALIVNRPFIEFSIAECEEQMRVNAAAGFLPAQAVAPGMTAQEIREDRQFPLADAERRDRRLCALCGVEGRARWPDLDAGARTERAVADSCARSSRWKPTRYLDWFQQAKAIPSEAILTPG